MTEQRHHTFFGWFVALMGLFVAAMVYAHPERAEAPLWVVYASSGAFLFAGLAIVASSSAHSKLQAWLAIGCMATMVVPGMWIAFWPGPRVCGMSVGFASGAAHGGACRVAFGSGAVIVGAMLVWAVKRALGTASTA